MPLRWICASASVVLCLGSRPDERGLPSAQAVASLDRRATQTGPVRGRESGPILDRDQQVLGFRPVCQFRNTGHPIQTALFIVRLPDPVSDQYDLLETAGGSPVGDEREHLNVRFRPTC
jgi:hypothetical protein